MKCLATLPRSLALLGSMVAFSTLLLSTPDASAQLSTWAYPNTADEKNERLLTLSKQLRELDQTREIQLVARTEAEEALVKLVSDLQLAEAALRTSQAPLNEALERFRKAQEIALTDPMINVEEQRLEYVRIEDEFADDIRTNQEEVDYINQLIPEATERLAQARQGMDNILLQIETLWHRQETIKNIVFLRTVDD